jgi:FKBP-type peptidyl-prolyl cis-trans isomerase
MVAVPGCAPDGAAGNDADSVPKAEPTGAAVTAEPVVITTGLTMTKLKNGYGRAAVAGDIATVHYSGWLYDENAPDGRGKKFDSSVDRGDPFRFPLGAGRVIRGWDEGVVGMLIGEKRELKIAPELGYGDRGAGSAIPPGATLLFEVELLGLEGPGDE